MGANAKDFAKAGECAGAVDELLHFRPRTFYSLYMIQQHNYSTAIIQILLSLQQKYWSRAAQYDKKHNYRSILLFSIIRLFKYKMFTL